MVRPGGQHVGDLDRRPGGAGPPGGALADPERRASEGIFQLGVEALGGAEMEQPGGRIELVDGAGIRAGEVDGVQDDRREHFLEVERGGDGLADGAERPQLLDRAGKLAGALAKLLEEAGVLDGDDGLIREPLQELDLPGAERPNLVSVDRDDADRAALSEQRGGQAGAVPDTLG